MLPSGPGLCLLSVFLEFLLLLSLRLTGRDGFLFCFLSLLFGISPASAILPTCPGAGVGSDSHEVISGGRPRWHELCDRLLACGPHQGYLVGIHWNRRSYGLRRRHRQLRSFQIWRPLHIYGVQGSGIDFMRHLACVISGKQLPSLFGLVHITSPL
jgi:hypothetical protein